MISIIVTAFECPDLTKECIERILNQEGLNEEFEIIVACPDEPTKKAIMDCKKKCPRIVKYVHQEYTCSKNQLMNEIFKIAKGRILIWTDGNKFFEKNSIKLLLEPFEDEAVGIVGGRIIPMGDRNTLYGFWAHLLTEGLHKMRKNLFNKNEFIEHTINILAMRNGIIKKIPLEVAEGAIISFLISNKGYKNSYVEGAKVYVSHPKNFIDLFKQRARSTKAHMELLKYTKNSQIKYHSFYNRIIFSTIKDTFKEFFWSLSFIFFLIYVQLRGYYSLRIRKRHYVPIWRGDVPELEPS